MEASSIYILAGGKSSRMGEDKATLQYKNKALLHHVLELAVQISPHIYLLSAHPSHQQFNLPMIPDMLEGRGAAGGIDAMLQHTSTSKNVVLSCDMPFVDVKTLQLIMQASNTSDITVPMYQGYPEPLLGVYDRRIKNRWRELLLHGENKLSNLLKAFNTHYVNGEKLLVDNPRLFSNFNSKDDILAAHDD